MSMDFSRAYKVMLDEGEVWGFFRPPTEHERDFEMEDFYKKNCFMIFEPLDAKLTSKDIFVSEKQISEAVLEDKDRHELRGILQTSKFGI